MIAKLTQALKSLTFYDYILFFLVFVNLISAYSSFSTGEINRGLDKLTIALLFGNMFLVSRIQDQSKFIIDEYQSLSDLKTQIINDQEKEIEALQQENAKLKAGLPIIK